MSVPARRTRFHSIAAVLLGLAYAALCLAAASAVSIRLAPAAVFELVRNAITLLLLLAGYLVLGLVFDGERAPLRRMGWWWANTDSTPYWWQMPGSAAAGGAAVGWGMAVLMTLPLALALSIQPSIDNSASAWGFTLIGLVTMLLSFAARETVFRGYVFQHLVEATSPVVATLLITIGFGAMAMHTGVNTRAELVFVMVQQMVLCAAALRTRSLWFPVMLAWCAREVLSVLFGLPVVDGGAGQVVDSSVSGPLWLTGGFSGPPASLFGPVVAVVALLVVLRITRRDVIGEIRGAAYAVDIDANRAPSAVHAAYNDPPKTGLVQIAPAERASPE